MNLPEGEVTAVVLGAMQDAGLPHAGCLCPRCQAAFARPELAGYAACLAIVDKRASPAAVWLIDATPDIKWQLNMLAAELGPAPGRPGRVRPPDGFLLTHAHLGHIGGLPQLGPEALAAEGVPVYGSGPLLRLLAEAHVWRPAVAGLALHPLAPGEVFDLRPGLSVLPLAVPHRDEWGVGTVAYRVRGPHRSLLYLPDIDAWEVWPEADEWLNTADIALVDASFYGREEFGGRAPVAHPFVPDTLRRFAAIPGQLVLTHINHTNPILDQDSPQRKAVLEAGAQIASAGLTFAL